MWGRVMATLKTRPAPATIFDAFVHLAPIVSLRGLPVALDYYATLLKELEERAAQGVAAVVGEKKRLMWDNIAIWYKVRELAELFAKHGCNFGGRHLYQRLGRRPSTSWTGPGPWNPWPGPTPW